MRTPGANAPRVLLFSASTLVALCGCAQRRPAAAPAPAARRTIATPSFDGLVRAARQEERRPVAAAVNSPVPGGVEPTLAQRVEDSDIRARIPLDTLVATLAGSPPPAAASSASDQAQATALRKYVEGRSKLLAGDAAAALEDLQSAADLDPDAPEPWRELGEAQRLLGRRSEAARSFRSAASRGLSDARIFEYLGREALERGDFDEANRLLSLAMQADLGKADPALTRIVPVELSRSLAARGHILAATQALRLAMTDSTALTSTTRYGAELGAIFRRQGDLWRDIGDGLCRLGRYADALEAYIQADVLPSLDRTPVRPRIVFALMKLGRPSSASAAVLDDIAGRQGRASETDLSLLRHIADHGGDAGRISSALGVLRSQPGSTPSIARDLSLAQASLLSGDAARRALRDHLAHFPSDITAAVQLLNALDTPAAAVRESAAIAHDDALAKLVAEALLRSRHDTEEVTRLAQNLSGSSSLIAAYLSAKQGRPAEGLSRVKSLKSPAALVARAEMGLDAGRATEANLAIEALAGLPGPEATRLRARCLLLMQRSSEALALMRPLVEPSETAKIDDLLLAGDLAARTGRADLAERWLNQALTLDAYDDRPYSLLMVLHSASGSGSDGQKLSRILRDMRENCPESRTLRMVRAREAMRRSQWDLAESELRRLVDEDPGEAGPVELLAGTWQDRLKTDKTKAADARAWLEEKLRRRPQSALLLAAWTTLEVATDRASEAEGPLRDALAAGAGPDVSRILERLLRDVLSRPGEADDLALARLGGASGPEAVKAQRTVADAIELADLSLRRKNYAQSVSTLYADLDTHINLLLDQALHIATLTAQCLQQLDGQAMRPIACDAASLFDLCIPLIERMPAPVHQQRLEALAACPSKSTPELIAAAAAATEQYPQAKGSFYAVAIQALFDAGRMDAVSGLFAACPPEIKSEARLISTWGEAILRRGSAADARAYIETLHEAGSLSALFNPAILDEVKDTRAEASYILGVGFASLNKVADSEAMYEFALGFDPDHAWACNNLGYSLADKGTQLDRASDLLERAFRAKPDEVPIIDSLGWLRYKQGIILDVMDADTGLLKTRGALSLLQLAASKAPGRVDNTIQDHLGDALWLAGRRDDAVRAWERAAQLSLQSIDVQRDNARPDADAPPKAPPTDNAEVVESRALLESTTAKREAAASGRPVRVAPQINNPDPQPISPPRPEGEVPDGDP